MLQMLLMMLETEEDQRTFADLYEEYRPLVYHIAKLHLPTKEATEDAVQEVFVALASTYERVKKVPDEKLYSYISVVSNYVTISCYRKEKKYIYAADENDAFPLPDVSDSDFDIFDKFTIDAAMEKLNEDERNIIQMRFYFNLTSKEISEICKISHAAARKRVQRAKRSLKRILDEGDF